MSAKDAQTMETIFLSKFLAAHNIQVEIISLPSDSFPNQFLLCLIKLLNYARLKKCYNFFIGKNKFIHLTLSMKDSPHREGNDFPIIGKSRGILSLYLR
jgi:hypothetical protein